MATTDPFEQFREDAANKITSTNRELLDTVDISKELDKQFQNVNSNLRNAYNNTTSVRDALNNTLDLVAKLGREYVDADKITERIVENRTKLQGIEGSISTLYTNELNKYLAIGYTQTQALQTLGDEKQMYDDILARMESTSAALRANVTAQEKEYVNLMKQLEGRKLINELLEESKDKVEESNEQLAKTQVKATALSKIFNSISKIPFLSEFMNFKLLADEFQKGFGKGITALGSQLKSIFKSPLFGILAVGAALVALIKSAVELDKTITAISNNLGISKDSTNKLVASFRQASAEGAKFSKNLDSSLMSITNQAKALTDMQKTLETNSLFTREMIENQIMMTKQLGLAEEETAGINKLSLISGQSSEKILQTAVSQNKTSISYKKIISEIAKVNSEIATTYKNNPELIAKAVIQANKLGMSLEQTQKISKSLLDFETSISGELESELLLGKQFNFEKARALALDGKSAEAAADLLGQMGGLNALTNMNVIQRERLAASIGMSAEELTTAAREQAVLNSLGVENRKALEEQYALMRANNDQAGIAKLQEEARKKEGGELLLQDIARLDLSTRFNETMDRLKEMLVSIVAGPLGQMLDGFTKLLANGPALQGIFNSLKWAAIAAAAAFAIINPAGALAAASILGAGLLGYAMTDEETTGEKPNTAPQPSLPTRNNNLPNYNNNQGGGGSSAINEETVKAIQELHNTVKQGAPVYMDSVKVGTTMAMNNHTK